MTKRTFDQYCPIAASLDLVGERWSLLLVRELLTGPKRYTDLRRALPGMWTNLLAERLRRLEAAGVVRRAELPAPAARTVYELTDRGRQLDAVVLALGRWGIPLLPDRPAEEEVPSSTALLVGLRGFFQPAALDTDGCYEVRLGDEVSTALVERGRLDLHAGRPPRANAILHADPRAILDLRLGRTSIAVAVADGLLRFEGDERYVERLRRAFALDAVEGA